MELKNKGGRKPKGAKPTKKLSFTASAEAQKVLNKIKDGNRSEFISKCIVLAYRQA